MKAFPSDLMFLGSSTVGLRDRDRAHHRRRLETLRKLRQAHPDRSGGRCLDSHSEAQIKATTFDLIVCLDCAYYGRRIPTLIDAANVCNAKI